jgi:hypothetical protein
MNLREFERFALNAKISADQSARKNTEFAVPNKDLTL